MKKLILITANINILIGLVLIIAPISYLILNSSGVLEGEKVYATYSTDSKRESEIITKNLDFGEGYYKNNKELSLEEDFEIPDNGGITHGNRIKINSIGLDTFIYEGWNANQALENGVWRMPNQGTPVSDKNPIILSAHRWGFDYLTWEYRTKNLFLNLPEIKQGDIIELEWFDRKYTYKVNLIEENTVVSRLNEEDDLILITCKYYNSDIRYFVYAEKVN